MLLFFTTPDCAIVGLLAGDALISYQLTWLPAPPSTAWATQITVDPILGSMPDTARISRPSSVSIGVAEPIWGASGGLENALTVIDCGLLRVGTLGSLFFGFSWYTEIFMPEPQMSGHSMSLDATTRPTLEGSVGTAGSGVNACEPFSFRRSVN